MDRSFILKIGKWTADFEQPINLNELQNYEVVVDPTEEIDVRLFIGEQEIQLTQVYRKRKEPNYTFRGIYRFENIGVQKLRIEVDGDTFEQKVRIRRARLMK